MAGRLSSFKKEWHKITKDQFILNAIDGVKIEFCKPPIQSKLPRENSKKDFLQLENEIKKLISKKVIVECNPVEGQFLSSYFLIPKKDGSFRFVLNLKKLNSFINTNHFQMEDLRTAIKLVNKGCFMTSIDLKDAYYLISVAKESRKFLRFSFGGKIFEFVCLPFGLCICPLLFTKIMKAVMGSLRDRGFISCIYLDDILCIGYSKKQCSENTIATIGLLEKLGFIINYEKSCLDPNTRRQYLGFILDSIKMSVELTQEKRQILLDLIKKFSSKDECSIREFAHLV